MKKTILGIISVLLLASMVAAIDNIKVDCGRGLDSLVCSPWELDQEFDIVERSINIVERGVSRNTDLINFTAEIILDNDARWSEDKIGGGGTSMDAVRYYMSGTKDNDFGGFDFFIDWMRNLFVPWDYMYGIEARVVMCESDENLDYSLVKARVEAKHTGKTVTTSNGFICKPDMDYCYKLSD